MKAQVSYSRKVSTREYENLSIGHQLEFDIKEMTVEQAWEQCRDFVEFHIAQRLHELGVKE